MSKGLKRNLKRQDINGHESGCLQSRRQGEADSQDKRVKSLLRPEVDLIEKKWHRSLDSISSLVPVGIARGVNEG